MCSHSVYQQTIVASYISYYCGVSLCLPVDDCGFISYYCGFSLCLPVDDCGFIHFILLWCLTLFTGRRLWLHSFHTSVGSHSVYRQTIVASFSSYYCGISLCLPVDDCGFIHFILVWDLTLFTGRRFWLHSFHTIMCSHSVYQQTIVASYISYYCGVSLCLPGRRLWLHTFHTSVGSHSVYRQRIVASYNSYYYVFSLCLPVDDCGFIHFILLWGLTLFTGGRLWLHFILLWVLTMFTSRRLWLHTFHTIVVSHSVYRQTIVASFISYQCGISLCLPVDDCGFIQFILLWDLTLFTGGRLWLHFILLWGLTLFTSRRLWLHTFHTIVGSHSVYRQTIVASFISYQCGISLCLPVDDCGFIHFILLWGLTLFTSRRLWLHTFHTIVRSHTVYRQTIVVSYISYYCGVSLCLPVDDCGLIHFILLWGLTLYTSRRLWLHTFHTIVVSHSFNQQTIVASFISYYCGVSLCLPVDDCGFIHFILLWGLTQLTSRRLWLHSFHTSVRSHSVYRQTIVASYISYYCGVSLCLPLDDCGFISYYCGVSLCLPVDDCGFISYYCGVSLCLPVDDCGFIHFILLWGLTLFTSRRLWLNSFHTSVGSHSVYRQTILASFISYYYVFSLCLPVDDCGFIHFILLWGLTLFTRQTIVASYISYQCGISLCLPVDDCGFIQFILLCVLTLFTSRRLWLHTFHTIVGSHSVYRWTIVASFHTIVGSHYVYQQTIVASYISYYCGVSLCLPVDDCGFIHFILVWDLTLFTGRRLWLHSVHTIVGSHSVYQQTIVASYISYYCEVSLCLPVDDCGFISYYCGVSLCLPVDDCGFIHFILLWGLTLFTGRRLWLHSFHTSVGSHSVYRQMIVASYISYYCGVSLCLPVDDCGFIHFILL